MRTIQVGLLMRLSNFQDIQNLVINHAKAMDAKNMCFI